MASVPFNNLITFSRGTNATLTSSNGLIQWAPANLLTNSESFNASAWSKSDATVTANATTAPDGTSTADKLAETATTAQHYLFQSAGAAGTYTTTIYAKAAERSWMIVTVNSSNTFFNISSGTVGSAPGGFTAAITDAGNGWYRCSVTATLPASGPIVFSTSTANNVTSYAGTAGSGIFIWGAQLELGTAATTYNPTTVKNLLGFSEAFDNAAWTKARASIVTGAQANPVNGAFNAQKLMEDTSNNSHFAQQAVASIVGGTTVTVSAYVKAAGRNFFVIVTSDQAGTFRTSYFDLANGTLGTVASGHTASITAVGNGWYRCAITQAQSATTGVFTYYPSLAAVNGSTSYQGDGSSGIYIYGAQLSDSASLDPYVPTPGAAPSSTAYYGPRFDYDPVTLQPKGILIEEQRTNLLLQSETFDNASWAKVGTTTVTPNTAVAPDGTTTADRVIIPAGSNQGIQQSVTISTGSYRISVWARAVGTATTLRLASFLVDGSKVTTFSLPVGGFVRYEATFTYAVGGTPLIRIDTNDVGGTIEVWGAQLEAGAFATSYIPTIASTVTRSADVATITGSLFSQWYGQPQGTFVVDFTPDEGLVTNQNRVLSTTSGGASNRVVDISYLGVNWVNYNGTNSAVIGAASVTTVPQRIAIAYATANYGYTLNGGTVATDSAALVNSPTQLNFGRLDTSGYLNGHIRSIQYYPVRAADFQLQALTA
jgi:hypothetical protein